MGTVFDRVTESDREKILMDAVRGGELDAEQLESTLPPFPLKIQIQTFSPCNARCVMCPWPETAKSLPQGAMPEARFRALVEQMRGRGVERTSLFLMNEPLLDERLEHFTRILKQAEPRTAVVLFTNGVLLTPARAESLAAAGVDEINVSINGFDRERFEEIMVGVDYDRVMENLAALADLGRRDRLGALRVKLVALEFEGCEDALERFREGTSFQVFLKPVTNRAGAVDLDELGVPEGPTARFRACQRPFVKAYVLYNGDVVLCNCDWKRTTILGNIDERPLAEIWRGEPLRSIRGHHLRRSLPRGSLCASCDYPFLT